MAVTITHNQVRSVIDGSTPYQVADTVSAVVGIPMEVFVFQTSTGLFDHVATVYDLETYPTSQDAAIAAHLDYFRLAAVTSSFAILPDAQDFGVTLHQRLQSLVIEYKGATTAFTGTTDETVTSG